MIGILKKIIGIQKNDVDVSSIKKEDFSELDLPNSKIIKKTEMETLLENEELLRQKEMLDSSFAQRAFSIGRDYSERHYNLLKSMSFFERRNGLKNGDSFRIVALDNYIRSLMFTSFSSYDKKLFVCYVKEILVLEGVITIGKCRGTWIGLGNAFEESCKRCE